MSQMELLRLSLSLVAVVILIFVAAWFARRSGLISPKDQSIRVVASQSLGGRNNIVIVEVEGQRLVLGVSQQQVNLLHCLPQSQPFKTELDLALSEQQCQQNREHNAS